MDEPSFLSRKVDGFFATMIDPFERPPVHDALPPGDDAVLVNGNDYLRLANHGPLRRAADSPAAAGPQQSGVYVSDEGHPKRVFERAVSDFFGYEAAELCQSGYCANMGLIQTVAGPGVPVYVDRFSHFSFVDGIRLAGAGARMFRHNCAESLAAAVRRGGPGVIALDAVYSTMGTIAPLEDLLGVAERTGCLVILDESHSAGILGPRGEGLAAARGLTERIHFVTMSFAKAFVTRAGLVAGRRRHLDFFRFYAGPAVFSSVVEPFDAGRCAAALGAIVDAGTRRARVRENTRRLRRELSRLGVCAPVGSQIIPLIAGNTAQAVRLQADMQAAGIFGSLFCPPATPEMEALYRLSIHSRLTLRELERIVEACDRALRRGSLAPLRAVQRARLSRSLDISDFSDICAPGTPGT